MILMPFCYYGKCEMAFWSPRQIRRRNGCRSGTGKIYETVGTKVNSILSASFLTLEAQYPKVKFSPNLQARKKNGLRGNVLLQTLYKTQGQGSWAELSSISMPNPDNKRHCLQGVANLIVMCELM